MEDGTNPLKKKKKKWSSKNQILLVSKVLKFFLSATSTYANSLALIIITRIGLRLKIVKISNYILGWRTPRLDFSQMFKLNFAKQMEFNFKIISLGL